MSFRWFFVVIAGLALVLTSCGSDKAGVSTPTAKTSAEKKADASSEETSTEAEAADDAPLEQLSVPQCADVYSAKLDLMLASDAAEAQPPADVLSGFNPPAKVQEAIDHFVETGGVQFEDEDYDEMNTRIDDWASAVCPQ
jgi:hypothetical protein